MADIFPVNLKAMSYLFGFMELFKIAQHFTLRSRSSFNDSAQAQPDWHFAACVVCVCVYMTFVLATKGCKIRGASAKRPTKRRYKIATTKITISIKLWGTSKRCVGPISFWAIALLRRILLE